MTKEELIKNQFPNDEFLQSAVLQIVDKCVAELEKENAELKSDNDARKFAMAMSEKVEKQLRGENAELKAQIEKMKRCEICKHYRWNHCSYEINISADCIQKKMKHFELKEIEVEE